MLGVTQGRGNSVAEILDYLKQAAYADSQPPEGEFFYMRNSDIRSQTRDVCYGARRPSCAISAPKRMCRMAACRGTRRTCWA